MEQPTRILTLVSKPKPLPDRLESWKEIAECLQRDVRTVRRWERSKNLPVHRLPGGQRARVFALRSELDAWWNSRGVQTTLEVEPRPGPAQRGLIRNARLVVLPFVNLGGDPAQEHFCNAIDAIASKEVG